MPDSWGIFHGKNGIKGIMTKLIYSFLLLFTLTSCVTTYPHKEVKYVPSEYGGHGYYSKEVDTDTWAVGYIYDSVDNQAPQQILNFIMIRAAELAERYDFKWMQMLTREKFEIIGNGKPYIDLDTMEVVYPQKVIGHVAEGGLFRGTAEHTKTVRYFVFSNNISCREHCGEISNDLEECMKNPQQKLIHTISKICSEDDHKCIDKYRGLLGNSCLLYLESAFYVDWNYVGFAEEYADNNWYDAKEIKSKYQKRAIEWEGVRKLRKSEIKSRYFNR